MTDKELWLSKLDSIRATIEALPDDIKILSIGDRYSDGMTISVSEHPALHEDSVEEYDNGLKWCMVHGDVNIGYLRGFDLEAYLRGEYT